MRGCVTRQHAARARRAVEIGQALLLDRGDRVACQFEHDGTAGLITQKQAEEQVSQLPGRHRQTAQPHGLDRVGKHLLCPMVNAYAIHGVPQRSSVPSAYQSTLRVTHMIAARMPNSSSEPISSALFSDFSRR